MTIPEQAVEAAADAMINAGVTDLLRDDAIILAKYAFNAFTAAGLLMGVEQTDAPEVCERDDPMFNRGVLHAVNLLAKTLNVTDWIEGDGSEDYDEDLSTTLLHIVEAKGLYSSEDGSWAALPAQSGSGVQCREDVARLADQIYEIACKCAGDYNYPDAEILDKAAAALRALPHTGQPVEGAEFRIAVGLPGSGPWDRTTIQAGPEHSPTVVAVVNRDFPKAIDLANELVRRAARASPQPREGDWREQHLQTLPDPLAELERAFGFLVEKRQLSKGDDMTGCTSYIQRKLQCGYNRAAHLLNEMVERRWLTEADRAGARRITREHALAAPPVIAEKREKP